MVPGVPEAYEDAWKGDPAFAEECLREWYEKVEETETSWDLTRLIESQVDPDRAISVIMVILALDKNGEELDLLAAGPLEDFLVYSGPEYINVIEALARMNANFRSLLAGVSGGRMDAAAWQLVKQVRGTWPQLP